LAVTGNISAGNVSATTFTGALSGAATSATTAGTVTTNAQPNITSTGTLTSLTVSGNISAGNVSATTFTGALSGAATTAGTVTTNAQPNITSVGTLASLGVSGNITAANITANSGVFTGNGSGLSAIAGANVSGAVSFATTANAVAGANVSGAVSFASTANAVAGANVSGQVGNALVAGTVYTNAQPNITSTGTLTSVTVTGNASANNFVATSYHIRSVGTGISAAGSTQGTATSISKEINIVSTVASGAGVILPAVAGAVITITNTSANSLLVYPASSAAINSLAANAGFTQGAGSTLQFIAPTTTQYYTVGATYA
jgi:hypothetical protein